MTKLGQLARLVRESHAAPMIGEPRVPVLAAAGELGVTFLGHSSFFVQMGGVDLLDRVNVLIDPVFATRLVVLRRQRRVGVRRRDLPAIDVVLVTHAHMDHLNRPTLRWVAAAARRLASGKQAGRGPVIVVPEGCEDLVNGLGFREVRTLGWWEETSVAGLSVTLTPAKHWGARMFKDTHRGFGGYVVADAAGHRLYHSGDTAYFEGFGEIGRRLGPLDVALLPIGAYFPDSYRAVHTSPEEALRAFVEVGAETMVPMHFGTFRLGREPIEEPPVRLMAEARRLGVEERVRVLQEGETVVVRKRRTEQAPVDSTAAMTTSRRGLLVKAADGRVVTPEMIKELFEDDFG